MSLKFSNQELDDMAQVQSLHMMDTCLIAEPTTTTNSYNLPEDSWSWTTANSYACGYDPNPGKEILNQVPGAEATVRLPLDATPSYQARIRITKRFGRSITPVTFAVLGQPRQGPSGLLVWLVKITDGSDG